MADAANETRRGLAGLPPDILDSILGTLTRNGEVDFLVATTSKQHDEPGMPLQSIGIMNDLVVRGIPVGDTLYITRFYNRENSDGSTRRLSAFRAPRVSSETLEERREWYAPLRRRPDGSVHWCPAFQEYPFNEDTDSTPFATAPDVPQRTHNPTTCAKLMGAHGFYADDVSRRLYLSSMDEEAELVARQHDLTPLLSEHGTPWVVEMDDKIKSYTGQIRARRAAIEQSDEYKLMPIEGSRANKRPGHPGTKLLLALNSHIKLYTESPIIASMPILSRVSPPPVTDVFGAFAAAPELEAQLASDNNKWLLCVPMDWVYQWQSDAQMAIVGNRQTRYVPYPEAKRYAKVGSTAERVRDLQPATVFDVSHTSLRLTHRSSHDNAASQSEQRRALRTIPGTSFDVVGPLLVHTFLAHGTPTRNLNDPAVLDALLELVKDERFCQENDVAGNLVHPTAPGARARARTVAEVDALFDQDDVLSIFGIV